MVSTARLTAVFAATLLGSTVALAQTPAPKAAAGYTLGVFARGVAGKYTVPDSIALDRSHVYVGYGDGNLPDGSDGKRTQIVQYSLSGAVEYMYTVPGHNDGLKIDPATHLLWALQNEDANPNAVIINPATHQQVRYSFQAAPRGWRRL